MGSIALFTSGIVRAAATSGATPARLCLTVGLATLLTGLNYAGEQAWGDALRAGWHAFGVILGCVSALAVAGFAGAAALLPLRGERRAATLLGEGMGAGLGAGLLAAMMLAALAIILEAARWANVI